MPHFGLYLSSCLCLLLQISKLTQNISLQGLLFCPLFSLFLSIFYSKVCCIFFVLSKILTTLFHLQQLEDVVDEGPCKEIDLEQFSMNASAAHIDDKGISKASSLRASERNAYGPSYNGDTTDTVRDASKKSRREEGCRKILLASFSLQSYCFQIT